MTDVEAEQLARPQPCPRSGDHKRPVALRDRLCHRYDLLDGEHLQRRRRCPRGGV